ncbi:hypothetical protein D5086_018033 [Populus alba]|uniref:Uncharacterized protein n=2 Tax=Populus alba TaxID=43335 RepID=A0ACC4BNL8_POPAL|nr:uncharacterized protein LOC118027647 [Populus alba]TKS01840.1 hypothetical protein D5086_0000169470 [Populus alba]
MVGLPRSLLLPIIFTSIGVVILFSLYQSTHHIPSAEFTSSNNPIKAPIARFAPQNFTLLIIVLAFNRLDSLSRCLNSLSSANYGGDTVHLHIHIDHFALTNESLNVIDKKLEESRKVLNFVDGFDWKFGNKVVHYRTNNVGLQAQWLEAWWPSSDHEFSFIVEDDMEVSPLFYKFVRSLIVNYYYNVSNFSPFIYGASLQRPRFVPGKHGNKIQLDSETHLFLYQLVGTWGQILFPEPWKEFRLWYDLHKSKGIKPFLDGMVTNGWYKRIGERIWTPWFIKFIHSRGYFNIYTNFQHERALSVSHRDAGVNYGKTAGPDSQLLDGSSLDFNLLEMQPLSNLKWYDYCFREVLPGRVGRTLDEVGSILQTVQEDQSVLLVNIFGASDTITRNMLCHFERLNIRNYVLIGPGSDFLFDLARRGHPVIDADQFFNFHRAQKVMGFQHSSAGLMKNILVNAYVIKKCLENGYDSLIVDANMLFLSKVQEFIDPTNDFYAGKSLGFFFVRSSSSAQEIWAGLLKKVAATIGNVLFQGESTDFVYLVKLLEQNGVRIHRVDEASVGIQIHAYTSNQSSVEAGKKMVYWFAGTGVDLIQKRLQELSLWVVDGDSSCSAVVCHQS